MLALLTAPRDRAADVTADRMTLVYIDPRLETIPPVPVDRPVRARRPIRAPAVAVVPAQEAPDLHSAPMTPGIDWYANGESAARRAAAEPTTRTFGFPSRETVAREKKPFGWDKTHTERVHALEGGGIGIHLSDNCELMLVPLPLGGCALGKREARGDLFDEMKAPPQMGDWK